MCKSVNFMKTDENSPVSYVILHIFMTQNLSLFPDLYYPHLFLCRPPRHIALELNSEQTYVRVWDCFDFI